MRDAYLSRTQGRTWGRPANGSESKYLLTGLAQCGWCNGGLFVHGRSHGTLRRYFYACTSHHKRGASICRNRQLLPMELTDHSVIDAFREDLLDPVVLTRAFQKLSARLTGAPATSHVQIAELEREALRLGQQLQRLAAALADGDDLPSVLAALREKETRRGTLQGQIEALRHDSASLSVLADSEGVQTELERRHDDWRGMLSGEVGEARQMVRSLLDGRMVFTPGAKPELCTFTGRGSLRRVADRAD